MKKLGLAVLFAGLLAAAFAAPTGASVTAGTQERWAGTSAGTVTTEGGNITQVNVTGYTVTTKWAGFWGEVSGGIRLADASGNVFYEWTVTDPTGGVVYVCNGTVSDWSSTNIQALHEWDSIMPAFLLEGNDAFNNTFTNVGTFNSPSLSIANVNYTYTWQNGAQGTTFATYALKAVNENVLIWAGNVQNDQSSFKGTPTADYQVLAGVNDPTGTTTFYFYLELP